MDVLRCGTPEMVVKETWMHSLAYNLIRGVMAAAAEAHGKEPGFRGQIPGTPYLTARDSHASAVAENLRSFSQAEPPRTVDLIDPQQIAVELFYGAVCMRAVSAESARIGDGEHRQRHRDVITPDRGLQ
jgi:hypothetical protein